MELKDISVGVTGFIDILGFSAKVLSADNLEDIKELHRLITLVQENFEFSNNDEMTQEVHELAGKSVLAFSDCVVFNIPLESESTKYSGTFDPFMMDLLSMAFSQGICVHNGLFVRGGIDIGWWYNKGDTLISSALVTSAKREATANVPVIALCEDLYEHFYGHSDRSTYSEAIDPIKAMFRHYEDSNTSFYYLDYIYLCLNNMDWSPRTKEEREQYQNASYEQKNIIRNKGYESMIENWLIGHSSEIKKAAEKVKGDSKVYSKYEWLAAYHNDVVGEFTTNPDCLCKLG